MKDLDYIAATNLANLRGALHLLGNYTHIGEGSDKVRQAYRAIAETEAELSEAVLASDDEPESKPPGTYAPDVVFPPGETILELMAERGMTTRDLQLVLGRPPVDVGKMLDGTERISPDIARRLEQAFNVPAQVWLNLDAAYVRWLENNPTRGPSQNSAE